MIFGLAVQVAPLIVTPLLLKLSGGLLGRIAGMINDPRKGLMDRTKNWSNDRAEMHRQKSLSKPGGNKNPFRAVARRMDNSNREVKERTTLYSGMNDNRYNSTEPHEKIEMQSLETQDQKQLIETRSNNRYADSKLVQGTVRNLDVELRNAKVSLDNTSKEVEVQFENLKATPSDHNRIPTELAAHALRAQLGAQQTSVLARQLVSAQEMQQAEFAEALATTPGLQIKAGGIDPKGAQRALAAAFAAQAKAHHEAVSNAASILTHYNYGDDTITDIALGKANPNLKINITKDIREAAITSIAGGANAPEMLRLLAELDIDQSDDNMDLRQAFADTFIKNGNKPKFAGAGILAGIKQGVAMDGTAIPAPGKARLDQFIAQTINSNKLGSADVLVSQDSEYLKAVLATLKDNLAIGTTPISQDAKTIMKKSLQLARDNPLYAGKIAERKEVLEDIDKLL